MLSRKLDAIGFRTSLIRDLSARGPMEREFITKQELEVLLMEDLEEDREDILVTQKLYQTLGITDDGTDLLELFSSAFSDIVQGLFDTEIGKLYIVADGDDFQPQDVLTVAHEFTHGLQQLNFDIRAIRESVSDNSDQARAFTALVEGDATLTQILYMFEHLDEDEQAAVETASANADVSAFLAAPVVVQRSIAFPYMEGPPFVIDLYLRNSDFRLVNEAYEYLPRSTEQIMHVEKYDAREPPVEVSLPDISGTLGKGWTELDRDTLGELFIGSYLGSVVGAATSSVAAAGWGGDRYALFENETGQMLFASVIAWDSESDATEFYLTYQELVENRLGGIWQDLPGIASTLTMETASQHALINQAGLITVVVLSPDFDTGLTALATLRFGEDE